MPIPKEQLPVELPRDLKPTGAGNPLAEREDFVNTTCPRCEGPAKRETDTLDCHFDALWLWIPACVPASERGRSLEEILALEDLRAWLPSERLVAGSDSGNFMFDQRITTKALRDIGPLAFLADGEPFAGALMHEMVIRDGRKMSKHLGNVVDPDELVESFGADTVRMAVLWAARPQKSLNWSDSAVQFCQRFLHNLWQYSQARFAHLRGGLGGARPPPHRAPAQALGEMVRHRGGEDHRGAGGAGDAQRGAQCDPPAGPHQGLREARAQAQRCAVPRGSRGAARRAGADGAGRSCPSRRTSARSCGESSGLGEQGVDPQWPQPGEWSRQPPAMAAREVPRTEPVPVAGAEEPAG